MNEIRDKIDEFLLKCEIIGKKFSKEEAKELEKKVNWILKVVCVKDTCKIISDFKFKWEKLKNIKYYMKVGKKGVLLTINKYYGGVDLEIFLEKVKTERIVVNDYVSLNFIDKTTEKAIMFSSLCGENYYSYKERISLKKRHFHNIEELKKEIIKSLSKISIGNDFKLDKSDLKILFEIFGEKYVDLELGKLDFDMRNEIFQIVYVFERNNKRFLVLRSSDGGKIRIICVDFLNRKYNYCDRGRIFVDNIFFTEDIKPEDLSNELFQKIINEFEREDNIVLIDKNRLNELKRKFNVVIERERKEEEIKNKYVEMVRKKLKKLGEKNSLIINNMKISRHKIEYDGMVLGCEKIDLVEEIVRFYYYEDEGQFDFNTLFERFIEEIDRYIENSRSRWRDEELPITVTIGKVYIEISEKVNKNGSVFYLLNNIRINRSEIKDCLTRAICFDNVEDYNKFLKDVSKCSLAIRNILSNGILVKVKNDVYGYHSQWDMPEIFLRLKFRREGKYNYLINGGVKLRVKNTSHMIKKLEKKQPSWSYNKMTLTEFIQYIRKFFDIDNKTLKIIIKDALKEYEEAEKKAKKLLEETVKIVGAKRKTVTYMGSTLKGYVIEGVKKTYFVSDDLKVFEYPSMNGICIVDRGIDTVVNTDKLVSRLLALKNDKFVAEEINTLMLN